MNRKYFVSFEVAQTLKEKGYPQSKEHSDEYMGGYDKNGYFGEFETGKSIVAPTYFEAIDWLFTKGIDILIEYGRHMEKNRYEAIVYVNPVVFKERTDINWYDFNYREMCRGNTKEEVLDKAIKKALTIC